MIDYINRDFTIPSEKQKQNITKEYENNGKHVLLIKSITDGINRGKIQVIWRPTA